MMENIHGQSQLPASFSDQLNTVVADLDAIILKAWMEKSQWPGDEEFESMMRTVVGSALSGAIPDGTTGQPK